MQRINTSHLVSNIKSLGSTALKAVVIGKILLTLSSCATTKYAEKENNKDSSIVQLPIDSAYMDSLALEEKYRKGRERYELTQDSLRLAYESELNFIKQNMSISKFPRKIKMPPLSECSIWFYVIDPDGRYVQDARIERIERDTTYELPIDDMIEGRYSLFLSDSYGDKGVLVDTYDYQKPIVMSQINIQNGELPINQDIQGPVRIVLMNLTNNTSQEVTLQQNFKQGETLNAFQYFDMTQLNGKNCCLIVQDGSGQTVFEEKFHKL